MLRYPSQHFCSRRLQSQKIYSCKRTITLKGVLVQPKTPPSWSRNASVS